MSQAGLGPLAASAVAAMLLEIRHIQTFHSVNLSGNPLGDPGCFALAEMLWQNEAVTRLDLRSCGTGIEGGQGNLVRQLFHSKPGPFVQPSQRQSD